MLAQKGLGLFAGFGDDTTDDSSGPSFLSTLPSLVSSLTGGAAQILAATHGSATPTVQTIQQGGPQPILKNTPTSGLSATLGSLSTPLLIGGGALVLFLLLRKRH